MSVAEYLKDLQLLCNSLVGNKLQGRYIVNQLLKQRKSWRDISYLEELKSFLLKFKDVTYFINNWCVIDDGTQFDKLLSVLDGHCDRSCLHRDIRLKNRAADLEELREIITNNLKEHESILPGELRKMNPEIQALVNVHRDGAISEFNVPSLRVINSKFLITNDIIGKGRNGYVCRGMLRDIPVAIKHLRDENFDELYREATILQLRNLPGVVRFFGVDSLEKPTILVMELGICSLSDWLHNRKYRTDLGRMTFMRKLNILTQCASTLAFLHSVNLLHRDIKPTNVVVMSSDKIKLSDFGHAKHLSDCDSTSLSSQPLNGIDDSRGTTVKGTDFYMAPELLLQHDNFSYSTATDVYSFGILINEVLSGSVPFDDHNAFLAKMHETNGEYRPELFLVPNRFYRFYFGLEALVVSCWQPSAIRRPDTASVAFVLETIFKSLYNEKASILSGSAVHVENQLFASSCSCIGYYTGEMISGKRHGKGTYECLRKYIYNGDWRNDLQDGKGICTFLNKSVYDGEWKNGLYHGQGVMQYENESYDGEWQFGHRIGHGVYVFSDGSRYDGKWDVFQEGEGTFIGSDGSSYSGDWRDGHREGHGFWKGPDNRSYIGEWKNGQKHGQGVYVYENGDKYDGEWREDKKHGHGIYKFVDGSKYVGEWKNDYKEGFGLLFHSDQEIEGEWRGDNLFRGVGRRKTRIQVPSGAIGVAIPLFVPHVGLNCTNIEIHLSK